MLPIYQNTSTVSIISEQPSYTKFVLYYIINNGKLKIFDIRVNRWTTSYALATCTFCSWSDLRAKPSDSLQKKQSYRWSGTPMSDINPVLYMYMYIRFPRTWGNFLFSIGWKYSFSAYWYIINLNFYSQNKKDVQVWFQQIKSVCIFGSKNGTIHIKSLICLTKFNTERMLAKIFLITIPLPML